MFVICQNDYPIGIAQTEEIVNKQVKELQRKFDLLDKKLNKNVFGRLCYFHYYECNEIDINQVLFKLFNGWDKEYIINLLKE